MVQEFTSKKISTESPVQTVYSRMSEMLGIPIESEADVWRAMQTGVSAARLQHLMARLRISPGAVGSETTIRRRLRALSKPSARRAYREGQAKVIATGKASGRRVVPEEVRLNPSETEKLARLTRVVAQATQLFGEEKAALDWLHTPADFLHDEKPMEPMKLAETESGARLVESMISRTAYGFF